MATDMTLMNMFLLFVFNLIPGSEIFITLMAVAYEYILGKWDELFLGCVVYGFSFFFSCVRCCCLTVFYCICVGRIFGVWMRHSAWCGELWWLASNWCIFLVIISDRFSSVVVFFFTIITFNRQGINMNVENTQRNTSSQLFYIAAKKEIIKTNEILLGNIFVFTPYKKKKRVAFGSREYCTVVARNFVGC